MLAALLLLAHPLDAVLDDPRLAGAIVAVEVADAEGRTLYSRNRDLRVMPASNQKLLTAAFALWALGPETRPVTRIWKEPGRVVVDAPGDPLLSHAQLVQARRTLRLDGRLPVYVRQAYRPGIPGGWQYDYLGDRYAPRISAFAVDQGGFELWFRDGLRLLPDAYGVRIVRGPATGPLDWAYDPIRGVVTVRGELPKEPRRIDTLAVPEPDVAAASLLGRRMVPADTLPARPADLEIVGGTTTQMVQAFLPPSDNGMAENLFLMAGRRLSVGFADPYAVSRREMAGFLERVVGIVPADCIPYDGSGLSRHNQVTARAITGLLAWSLKQPTAAAWRAALARPGQPGTLRNRLAGVVFEGKTGSLNHVSALSGYVRAADGTDRIVSVIINHFAAPTAEIRAIQDRVIQTVADEP